MIKARGSSHYTSASPQTSQTRFLGLLWRVHLEHTMKAGVLPPDDDDDEGCPSAASAVAVQSTISGGATVALLLLLSEGDDVDAVGAVAVVARAIGAIMHNVSQTNRGSKRVS